jgi:hypothetical protein
MLAQTSGAEQLAHEFSRQPQEGHETEMATPVIGEEFMFQAPVNSSRLVKTYKPPRQRGNVNWDSEIS